MWIFILQPVLDPHINYEGLCAEAHRDKNVASQIFYLEKIESAKKISDNTFLITMLNSPPLTRGPLKNTPTETYPWQMSPLRRTWTTARQWVAESLTLNKLTKS